jgi:hypothetical protein
VVEEGAVHMWAVTEVEWVEEEAGKLVVVVAVGQVLLVVAEEAVHKWAVQEVEWVEVVAVGQVLLVVEEVAVHMWAEQEAEWVEEEVGKLVAVGQVL